MSHHFCTVNQFVRYLKYGNSSKLNILMLIAIRVDASSKIGLGHLMRCLTLANEAALIGAKVIFVCRDLAPVFLALIEKNGHQLVVLNNEKPHFSEKCEQKYTEELVLAHASWLAVSWEQDAAQCKAALSKYGVIDWLVVDHYSLDARWETEMQSAIARIMVIDDLADRPHNCHLLLDQNYYRNQVSRYRSKVQDSTKLLLGPSFALLRRDFRVVKASTSIKPMLADQSLAFRISICFGGVDPAGASLDVLVALESLILRDGFIIDVIVGSASPFINQLKEFANKNSRINVHVSPPNLAELLSIADLAIGASGSMTWERACLGVPSIAIAVAENQVKVGEDAGAAGVHLYLGRLGEVSPEMILMAVNVLVHCSHLRLFFSELSRSLCDANGAERVVRQMFCEED